MAGPLQAEVPREFGKSLRACVCCKLVKTFDQVLSSCVCHVACHRGPASSGRLLARLCGLAVQQEPSNGLMRTCTFCLTGPFSLFIAQVVASFARASTDARG